MTERMKTRTLIKRLIILPILFVVSYVVFAPTEPDDSLIREAEDAATTHNSRILSHDYIVLIDHNRPIYKRRLWVIERKSGKCLLNEHVSHAWNSGLIHASEFSNEIGSEKSSTGAFVTGESYHGEFGYAMRLDGLEPGINDNARTRAIVFHQSWWPYSRGCFMTWPHANKRLIDLTAGGRLVYVLRPQ